MQIEDLPQHKMIKKENENPNIDNFNIRVINKIIWTYNFNNFKNHNSKKNLIKKNYIFNSKNDDNLKKKNKDNKRDVKKKENNLKKIYNIKQSKKKKNMKKNLTLQKNNFSKLNLKEITFNFLKKENTQKSLKKYSKIYPKKQNRSILIKWLINVHKIFKLTEKTLFLALDIIDLFLTNFEVHQQNLQLVGISAFFLCSKFEEVCPPFICDFEKICYNLYSKSEILRMESELLFFLNFDLIRVTCFDFFSIFAKFFNFDSFLFNFGLFLMNVCFFEFDLQKRKKSLLAFSVCLLISKIFKFSLNLKLRIFDNRLSYVFYFEGLNEFFYFSQSDTHFLMRCVFFNFESIFNSKNDIKILLKKFTSKKYSKVTLFILQKKFDLYLNFLNN